MLQFHRRKTDKFTNTWKITINKQWLKEEITDNCILHTSTEQGTILYAVRSTNVKNQRDWKTHINEVKTQHDKIYGKQQIWGTGKSTVSNACLENQENKLTTLQLKKLEKRITGKSKVRRRKEILKTEGEKSRLEHRKITEKNHQRSSKIIQLVKVLAAKTDDLSLKPGDMSLVLETTK